MEVNVLYLHPDPKTGVLRYRRVFPKPLRAYVRDGGRPLTELKVSLEARSINEPGAKARFDAAAAKYEQMVARARKLASGAFDPLDQPLAQFLANKYLHHILDMDEAARWRQAPPSLPFETRSDPEADYETCRTLLADFDGEGLVEYWKDWVISYTRALGYAFDPSTRAFAILCREFGEVACKVWLALDARIDHADPRAGGRGAATPVHPETPASATIREVADSSAARPSEDEGMALADIALSSP